MVNHLCIYYQSKHDHRDVIADFYCFACGSYICADCFELHREHNHPLHGKANSIKNHLGEIFNKWISLMDRA